MTTPHVRPEHVKTLTSCPACGSKALADTESKASRTTQRVAATALGGFPLLGPNGKKCLDCGWQVG